MTLGFPWFGMSILRRILEFSFGRAGISESSLVEDAGILPGGGGRTKKVLDLIRMNSGAPLKGFVSSERAYPSTYLK